MRASDYAYYNILKNMNYRFLLFLVPLVSLADQSFVVQPKKNNLKLMLSTAVEIF